MSVIRVAKNNNYVVMGKHHLKERDMSLKAKGLLSLMLSLPDEWDYSISGLVAICKENETAIKSTLNELQDFGYLKVTKLFPHQTESGRIEYIYDVFEKPQYEDGQPTEKQGVENLCVEVQGVENPIQLNNKELSNKELNNKYITPPTPSLKTTMSEDDFNTFWNAYPRKVSKQTAKKVFMKLNKSILPNILGALESQKQSAQWLRDNGQYIPHPSTWINGARWEDEVEMPCNNTQHVVRHLGYEEI